MPRTLPRLLAIVLVTATLGPARANERVCAPDPSGARLAVELGFAELLRLHRARVPGPTGQALLDHKIDRLLDRFVGFDRFIDEALGEAWDLAPERRADWRQTLSDTLRQRYLEKLGSPLGVRLEIRSLLHDCDEVKVGLLLHPSPRKPGRVKAPKAQEVELRFFLEPPRRAEPEALEVPADPPEPPPPEPPAPEPPAPEPHHPPPPPVWRAFDVTVDGVSLLETWRGRFRKLFIDGGVAAIDQHMRTLRDRYPRKL